MTEGFETECKERIQAALQLLELPDAPIENQPGCPTMHVFATTSIISCYEQLGEHAKANAYKQMLVGLLPDKINPEKATVFKLQGNQLMSQGRVDDAIKKYEQALAWNMNDETILSNLSHAHIQLENFDTAVKYAQRSIKANSKWAKGFFRLGKSYMGLEKYKDAQEAFQQGLDLDSENLEFKKAVQEAGYLFKKLGNQDTGFSSRTIGILMTIQRNSWDIHHWLKNADHVHFLTLQECNDMFLPFLETKEFLRDLEAIMQTRYPSFKKWMLPLDLNPQAKSMHLKLDNQLPIMSYILPFDPLLTSALFLSLLKLAKPTTLFSSAFTFDADPNYFKNSEYLPFVLKHGKYAAIVSADDQGMVIDFLSLWAMQFNKIGDLYFADFVSEKALDKKNGWIYTLFDQAALIECLEAIYSRERKKEMAFEYINQSISKKISSCDSLETLTNDVEEETIENPQKPTKLLRSPQKTIELQIVAFIVAIIGILYVWDLYRLNFQVLKSK